MSSQIKLAFAAVVAAGLAASCVASQTPPASQAAAAPAPLTCAELNGKTFGAARVLEAHSITQATQITSAYSPPVTLTGPLCRVQGQIQPTSDSDIRFEVWLPERAAWNGHYQGVGGGGNSGNIFYPSMKNATDGGYAVSAQDNGHVGDSGDSSYAIGHPEKVIDFGWRSLHEVAVASKAVIAAHYGKPQDLSLFNGCSTGGRQALALAQRFPEDYDGVSAGAPANYWPELNALHARYGRTLLEHPEYWVPEAKLKMVESAVHKACGAVNGIIDDPASCKYDVAQLACTRAKRTNCLTAGEVAGLKARFADLVAEDGTMIYPGATQGYESALAGYWMGTSREKRFYTSGSWRYPEKFFGDYVHAKSDWTVRQFDLKSDLKAAQDGVIGKAVEAQNPDLSAFAKRGGKVIQWHGYHDVGISARNSIRYRDAVVAKMGKENVDPFYRLFLGTGVGHCAGGPGPDSIGAAFGAISTRDADHDVMEALVRWIKQGRAPEQIIATKLDQNGAVVAQRPWCAYPNVARWDGKGDRSKAESYSCPATQ